MSNDRQAKDTLASSASVNSSTSTNVDFTHHDDLEKVEDVAATVPEAAPTATQGLATTPAGDDDEASKVYATGLKLFAVLAPAYIGVFLVSLDRMIIATAVPRITDEFKSFGDIEWYGSAYLLTMASFMLLFGRIYTFFSVKWTYISCIALFEVGSILCAAAPSSVAFILGRAIAGLGSAGIMNGGIIIILHCVPLAKRPLFQASFAAIFGISSVIGPVLGGILTSKATWRWCFWLNVPFGGIVLVLLLFFLNLPKRKQEKATLFQQLLKLDLVGTPLLVGCIICLLLALQWGGSTYAWSDGRIIALFVLFAVLFMAFIAVQWFMPATATMPLRLFRNRTLSAAVWYGFCVGGAMQLIVYFSALWLQAIKNATPIHSGVLTIPMVGGMVVASIVSGGIVQKTGVYNPFAIGGSVIMSLGAGLLAILNADSPTRLYQIIVIFGVGMGACMQQGNLAIQVALPFKDVATGISLAMVGQTMGGAISIAIAQTALNNKLAQGLRGIPGLTNSAQLVKLGATQIRSAVAPEYLHDVLVAYNAGLRSTFFVALAFGIAAIGGALLLEWKNLKTAKAEQAKAMQQKKDADVEAQKADTKEEE